MPNTKQKGEAATTNTLWPLDFGKKSYNNQAKFYRYSRPTMRP